MTKYQTISALAEYTARNVAQSEENWKHYLTTAARLYKYPFNEQILIYAQRPDATACASLETWNEKMNCWVNRGAKGIALIDTDSERPRLKYVFDVSDVHKARRIGREPYLWELKEEHKAPVLAQLEKTYGATVCDKESGLVIEEKQPCVHCGSINTKKHGKISGRQRFICKACGKSFNTSTGAITSSSRLTVAQWKELIRGVIENLPIGEIAKNVVVLYNKN